MRTGSSRTVEVRVSGDGSSAPTIISASSRTLVVFGSAVPTVVPRRMTVMESHTRRTSSSLCEMKRTVRPSRVSSLQVAEELVDLLRDQDGGRLVEDQDAGVAVEHLGDLDPLAGPDAEVLEERVGIQPQGVAVADLPDPPAGLRAVQPTAPRGLAAQDDVLQDREVVGQHEVLVDHADAGGDGVAGLRNCISRPSIRIVPSSGRCSPYSVFISVDLPAPFSPTIAWISPRRTVSSMSRLATTPGNRLVMPRSSHRIRRRAGRRPGRRTGGAPVSAMGWASPLSVRPRRRGPRPHIRVGDGGVGRRRRLARDRAPAGRARITCSPHDVAPRRRAGRSGRGKRRRRPPRDDDGPGRHARARRRIDVLCRPAGAGQRPEVTGRPGPRSRRR